MASAETYDVLVIGGGPAGYVGAIRAGQLGLKTACVERDRLGGVCNNWGCIPTKALLANAELYRQLTQHGAEWGIHADNIRHDWSQVINRSRGVADLGAKGVGALFKKNKVTHLQGHARIIDAGRGLARVEIHDRPDHVERVVEAKHVVIATGARPRSLPGIELDGQRVIGAKQAMSLPQQPKELLIIGAGAIGMEFAFFYNAFGTKVTVVEMLDRVLPVEDAEVSKAVERAFKKQGITILTAHKTTALEKTESGIRAKVEPVDAAAGQPVTIEAQHALLAVGVQGLYDGLFDEKRVPIAIEKNHVKVDYRKPGSRYQTSVPGVYAVGDVIGPPWLAHVASEEAIACIERIAGHKAHDVNYDAIPGCTYCSPQVASIGKTEQALQGAGLQAGKDYRLGKFPFLASGKARATGHTDGFVKILSGAKHGEILGVHMVGENVTELIAEMGVAITLEATVDELIATMHAHPTLSEAIHEAALGAEGRMIHF
jgi:dihydrolipoamide dehydrogenase